MYQNRDRIRQDGKGKVTGTLKYLTDLTWPDMLYGKILRSRFPHAKIVSISTEKAESLPGVKAVITHQDVPGLNRFGIVTPDQPVLCEDIVRYVGDAIAAVAADSLEIATAAIDLIEVNYEELPVLDSPEKALVNNAPQLHPDGNVLHTANYHAGNIDQGFANCEVVVEETYQLPRQMHTYMETEGGVIVPEDHGGVTVYVGTQHGYKDRFQLSRILNIEEEKIRIVSSPMGGSFGGKDELSIQPYGVLLALKAGLPVKIHQTRKESVISGLKRHPMKITMKTGVDKAGKLLAHKVDILADTGAYATLGPAILDFAVEHATGPYRFEHVAVEGISVFTNNGVSGEFRGFGGNQVTFALEGQIDRLAAKLQVDPIEFRRINIRKTDDPGPMDHRIVATNGASQVLEHIDVHRQYHQNMIPEIDDFKVRGMGVAISMHGGGLGYGRLDPSGGQLTLADDGKIEIAFGFEEAGQGIINVIETIVTEELGIAAEDFRIVIGDTDKVPSSGSTTASRGTSMVWHAVNLMKNDFRNALLDQAVALTGLSKESLELGPGGVFQSTPLYERVIDYQKLANEVSKPVAVSTQFDFPTTPDAVDGGHYLYTFSSTFAQVEINLLTGKVSVLDLDQAVAAGPVVSMKGYTGQIEGGGVMSLGYALMEEAVMKEGKYMTENLDGYLIPGIRDVPFSMGVTAIEDLEKGDPFGPRGVGEIGTVAVAPAIAKAIHDAIGYFPKKLPISSEEVLMAITAGGKRAWNEAKQFR
ncbi:xanthine dehydrogenase subunit D [Gracilibacillus salinarum]|uniref:Xanthine dehydrogenase subunit D n=1 Tax=Gracilibacillus salinarum TaxID=2932255 RepID=A0ABY4GHA1_9BACI|nr:xanthine dehydrogenase subunit D [Gracilibacillus salinarum]UOQ83360.1 xanthine dehydrogenase subunit D [Gracilibacillus salinarum]